MAMVSLIRDARTMTYAGVVMRNRSTFCKKDMKVMLNKKNKPGLNRFRRISLNPLARLATRRTLSYHL